jgi:hypothetical protein
LETGFSYAKTKHFCNSVRVTLPDSGVESLVNDVLDVIQLALDGNCRPERLAALPGTYMFPLSIWVPEGNHLWGLILRTVLFNIPWFDAWFLAQKIVVAFLRDDANRLVLRLKLERDGSPLATVLRFTPTSPI